MEYRRLGKTGIDISVIGFGAWGIAGGTTWGDQDESQAIGAIHAALGHGINFFDTAENYGQGRSEELLCKGLGKRRRDVVIATKYRRANAAPQMIREACEGSLQRLGRDVIDLYQLHWPNPDVPFADQMGALKRLRAEGKIRTFGVCNCGPQDLTEALASGALVSDQMAYSLLWRAIEFEVVAQCVKHDLAILPYSPLMQGLLTGKFRTVDDVPEGRARTRHFSQARPQAVHNEVGCERETFEAIERIRDVCARIGHPMAHVSLAWLLAQPAVVSVLAGARSPEQVKQNARAAGVSLGSDILQELSEPTEDLKQKLGSNSDLWEHNIR